ncbi:YciN family protein [Serratia sp. AKBS12]|uniref:YciN family protein n=1 Tax=Serratia sp. AKBS12 TaxID=2974597 RepID=UPI0021663B97|nr:YciN family protein [Serratia sp. AKBS12]MCS3408531.1 YciN family protein [Serratia sp. AKBS12]HEI8864869.1 YciN family protein [Serratia odorifera]
MRTNTSPITRQRLLSEANNIIRQHEDYLHGMEATEVEQKSGVLVFRGEFFLDKDGLPTAKTTAVFNMFKHLAHLLSDKYHLVD